MILRRSYRFYFMIIPSKIRVRRFYVEGRSQDPHFLLLKLSLSHSRDENYPTFRCPCLPFSSLLIVELSSLIVRILHIIPMAFTALSVNRATTLYKHWAESNTTVLGLQMALNKSKMAVLMIRGNILDRGCDLYFQFTNRYLF